jgi:ribosome maturation factor RimP
MKGKGEQMSRIESLLEEKIAPIIEKEKMELIDIQFVKEGSEWFLRFFIDKEEGINLDDCEKISRLISELLDIDDPIEQAYHLEVSSPGIERPLKKTADFLRFVGEEAEIRFFAPFEGKKKIMLKIADADEFFLTGTDLEDNKERKIPREVISKAKLTFSI